MHESCRKRHYVMFSFFSLLRCRWMCLLWFQRWVTVSSGYHNSDNDRHSVEKAGKIVQPFCRDLFSITDLLKFSCSVHWNASGPSDIFPEFALPAGCDQDCDNTPGSYSCSCERGFQLQSDGESCTGGKHEKCWLITIIWYSYSYRSLYKQKQRINKNIRTISLECNTYFDCSHKQPIALWKQPKISSPICTL